MKIIGLLVALSMFYGFSSGCDCSNEISFDDEYSRSEPIFLGTVISINLEEKRIKFLVHDVFKGDLKDSVVLIDEFMPTSCGRKYLTGQKYLVYAVKLKLGLTTSYCSRTRVQNGRINFSDPNDYNFTEEIQLLKNLKKYEVLPYSPVVDSSKCPK